MQVAQVEQLPPHPSRALVIRYAHALAKLSAAVASRPTFSGVTLA